MLSFFKSLLSLRFFVIFAYLHVCVCPHGHMCAERHAWYICGGQRKDNLQTLVLSFYHMGARSQTQEVGLVSAFTC